MSVPLDRLYYFLHDRCNHDVLIYHFYPHGSKKPENVRPLFPHKERTDDFYLHIPVLFHDQEPLQFSSWDPIPRGFLIPDKLHSKFKTRVSRFSSYDKIILVHSELRSTEVEKFANDGTIPVYYWSHAIIAADWFRYAEHDRTLDKKTPKKKFLIYNRAWKGSREYRLKFADLLVDNNLQPHCLTSFSPTDSDEHYTQHNFENQLFKPLREDLNQYFPPNIATSSASADYNQEDYQSTEIEIVLETLFDDSRWHITEKTLRALAVGQPFILCSTPGSLEYLRRYGFETFNQCWDESYDQILDPIQRLEAVIKLMKSLTNSDTTLAQKIAQRNRQRFFSKEFANQVMSEFQTNFDAAVEESNKHRSCAYFLRHYDLAADFRNSISPRVLEYVEKLAANASK